MCIVESSQRKHLDLFWLQQSIEHNQITLKKAPKTFLNRAVWIILFSRRLWDKFMLSKYFGKNPSYLFTKEQKRINCARTAKQHDYVKLLSHIPKKRDAPDLGSLVQHANANKNRQIKKYCESQFAALAYLNQLADLEQVSTYKHIMFNIKFMNCRQIMYSAAVQSTLQVRWSIKKRFFFNVVWFSLLLLFFWHFIVRV